MQVSTGSLDHGHDVCGSQSVQEIERKVRVSLFMYFIDLQKSYDSVDRTLL